MKSEIYLKFSPFFAKAYNLSDFEWEKLQDRIEKLPPNLYDFLINPRTAEFIEKLVNNKNLNETTGVEVSAIIKDVVVGVLPINNLANELQIRLNVEIEQANNWANYLITGLLPEIMGEIKDLQGDTTRQISRPQLEENRQKTNNNPINTINLRNNN